MTPMALSDVARMAGGRLHGDDVAVRAVATDTRAMPAAGGALFVALHGANFDGHDHVHAALAGAAAAALVSRVVDVPIPQVVVPDTQRALAQFAAALQRSRVEAGQGGKVVAITGSNGKTSVKALVVSILERAGRTWSTPGNRNNEIGLPLAVIDAPQDAQFAVYEMGAGQPGDIAYLTGIVRPDVSVVNNIAPAHLERMGSLLGVADTKAAIYDALPHDGVAVVNADDAFAPYFAERALGRRLLRFGIESTADVTARDIRGTDTGSAFTLVTPHGTGEATLALAGRHNVRNALAAAALALGAGVSLETVLAGLAAAQPVGGRVVRHVLPGGVTLIDDSYNANPGSLNAAIDLLAEAGPGSAWLVLGDMRELGADAAPLHAEAGRRARAAGIARLYALGELSAHAAQAFGEGARGFDGHGALAAALREDLAGAAMSRPGGGLQVLVKGSRGSAMDRIVTALLEGEAAHAA